MDTWCLDPLIKYSDYDTNFTPITQGAVSISTTITIIITHHQADKADFMWYIVIYAIKPSLAI